MSGQLGLQGEALSQKTKQNNASNLASQGSQSLCKMGIMWLARVLAECLTQDSSLVIL